MNADHAVMDLVRGDRFVCLRCGEAYAYASPVSMNMFGSMAKGFAKDHKACKPHPDGDLCLHCNGRGHPVEVCQSQRYQTPEKWIHGTDTGVSSKTIWSVMMGRRDFAVLGSSKPSRPYDADDFGRCYRLLKQFPSWRERLGEMKTVNQEWSLLVDNWDQLEQLYETCLDQHLQFYKGQGYFFGKFNDKLRDLFYESEKCD